MKRFFALFKAGCGQLFEGFVQARLMAELPDANERLQHRIVRRSDDPRSSGGPPIVGIL
jgi:hypothetical protein